MDIHHACIIRDQPLDRVYNALTQPQELEIWMDAPTVAREGYDAVMAGKNIHVNGRVNRTIAALVRLLPQRLVESLGRRMGRAYRKA